MKSKCNCVFIYLFYITTHLFSQVNELPDPVSKTEACNLTLDKFVDRKLYVKTNTIPDSIKVLLNNKQILFKSSGKMINIYFPVYVDGLEKSYVRIYATKFHQPCKELIIPLKYGKPIESVEDYSNINWDELNTIKSHIEDTVIATTVKTIDTIVEKEKIPSVLPKWISVYIDTYYALYNDSVGTNQFQKFPSISPRSNSIGLNTAQINFQYESEKIRATAIFQYGDFAQTTWSSNYNNIMEAHAGFRLSKKLWIDAGFFRSHIGTEGLLPIENICSSISLGTIFSPAQVSGLRFNYLPNDKWIINLYILNGYSGFEDINDKKSIGLLTTFAFNDKGNIGYSNYLGEDTPKNGDSISHLRFHQNIYFNYQFNKLKLQIGGDFCLKENSDLINSTNSGDMLSGVASANYSLLKKVSVYSRFEFFNDPNSIMSTPLVDTKGKLTGYKLWGITAGLELRPMDKIFLRLEGRRLELNTDQQIFSWNGLTKSNRSEIMLNVGVSF